MPDLILAGGGLANGLLAYRIRTQRPDIRLLMIEQAEKLGGAHTWSFHGTDLTPDQNDWITPFVAHDWPHYEVAFPGHRRRVGLAYRSVSAESFSDVVTRTLGQDLRLQTALVEVGPRQVTLAGGETIQARAVIDGRGFRVSRHMVNRYQKFVGLEVRLQAPHGLTGPILMDATVPQADGYRFVYVLPFTQDGMLIEDTYYSDRPGLDIAALTRNIEAYAAAQGWRIAEILRRETGVLPITLSGNISAFWNEATPGLPPAGLRAGLFHPTTGFSLPDAVRLADRICGIADLEVGAINRVIQDMSTARWNGDAFCRLLNRMLFLAGPAENRFVIMRRFYQLSEGLIGRFYAGDLTRFDKFRLLTGKPPVSIPRAIQAMLSTGRQAA